MKPAIEAVEAKFLKKDVPQFNIGDTVEVHVVITEGQGKEARERVQRFVGTAIARKGYGLRETFTVRKIVQGEGVERVFPLHSPKVADVVVKRRGKVRRAKLYYLRDRIGRATRVKQADYDRQAKQA